MKIKFEISLFARKLLAENKQYGISETAETMQQLRSEILYRVNLYFGDKGYNTKYKPKHIVFKIPITQLFNFYPELNQKALAKRLDMNETLLSQYVNGKKKVSPKTAKKIMAEVNQLGRELMNTKFL